MPVSPLSPDQLYRSCSLDSLDFKTTEDLEDLSDAIGQLRAIEAVKFGIGIRREGYNLFALGPGGTGKRSLVDRYLRERAQGEPVPDDWCYVNNFSQSHKPRALHLPPGRGTELRRDMLQLVEDLQAAIPAAFESEEYRTRLQAIQEEFKEREEQALSSIQEEAGKRGIALIRTPSGFAFAPSREGEVLSPEDYEKLSDADKQKTESDVNELQEQLRKTLHKAPQWRKEGRDRVKTLNRETAAYATAALVENLRQRYSEFENVVQWLNAVEADVVENADEFRGHDEEHGGVPAVLLGEPGTGGRGFNRYMVNVMVGHEGGAGAPVVHCDNPAYTNLIGRVEHLAQMGALVTDFTMIKPGALHEANGGYLVLDVQQVLMQPLTWDALKRALRSRELRIESPAQFLSLVSTVSLEPEPVPLDVKVVLTGDRMLYYLLSHYDPEFDELFKVAVDFEEHMPRNPENDALYARLLATIVRREELRHFDRGAVARVIEHSSRLAEDAGKLTTHMRSVADLLRESDYWAAEAGRKTATTEDVQKAIDAKTFRSDRVRERIQESIQRRILLIDTEGEKTGQLNGLSVLSLGSYSFGHPTRITATARVGEGEVLDIEREVELGGPIHSKGVLILSGYLRGNYALDRPLNLSASIVFEQSYGEVEGDSASSAELYALLSALARVPLRQSLAVTGSVNQAGEVQPIGGVNEKIEGFFDVCNARGLTGEQGVLVPAANVQDLMLRHDVVEAVRNGRFAIYPVETINQGLEILTGMPAGERSVKGRYPVNSVNGRVEETLRQFTDLHQEHSSGPTRDEPPHRGKPH